MRPDEHLHTVTTSTEIVVADTSPLNYLVQLECDFLLPLFYQRVLVPPTVVNELSHNRTPQVVFSWAKSLPTWIKISPPSTAPHVELSFLGPGERDAIQLALELGIPKILIDEQQGKREAHSRGLTTTGTLGVLIAGHKAG